MGSDPDSPAEPGGGAASRPAPHGQALEAALANPKTPPADRKVLSEVIVPAYRSWRLGMTAAAATADVERVGVLVNAYKRRVELEAVYDSDHDFLSRQQGQLKLSSTILEETLPFLVPDTVVADAEWVVGPRRALAGINLDLDGSVRTRTKDQDFVVGREVAFSAATATGRALTSLRTVVPSVAAEVKTNLDATGHSAANSAARDLRWVVPDASFVVVCEWLDMTPVVSGSTFIDEVLVLRGRRPAADERWPSAAAAERAAHRERYVEFLDTHPVRADMLGRFAARVAAAVATTAVAPAAVVTRGWF